MQEGLLLPSQLRQAVGEWLREDINSFDVGGAIVGPRPTTATYYAKSPMILAGLPFATAVFDVLGCKTSWLVKEGQWIAGSSKNRVPIGTVSGPANSILQGERTALEVLTRCSAVATSTTQFAQAARQGAGTNPNHPPWGGKVAATRKTTPGSFRLVEKYGVLVGGGDTHRYNLSSAVMLKDNHIDVCSGSIAEGVRQAKAIAGFTTKVEVECRSEEDAVEACKAGADIVMLDNFTPATLREVAPRLKKAFPHVVIETSGGITRETIPNYAVPGVDIISVGALTHGYPSVDISLKVNKSNL